MRDRLEDMGRIMVLLDQLLDHQCWDNLNELRSFNVHSNDVKEDILTSLSFSFESLKEDIGKCLEIAKAEDYLNEE